MFLGLNTLNVKPNIHICIYVVCAAAADDDDDNWL